MHPCCLVTQGNAIESEHLSELTEEEYEAHYIRRQDLKGFMWLDAKYLNPFFTRRLTQEVGHGPATCAGVPGLPSEPRWPRVGGGCVVGEPPTAGVPGAGSGVVAVRLVPACSHLLVFLVDGFRALISC